MKNILIIVFLTSIIFVFNSCKNESNESNNLKDIYYVKYDITTSSIYSGYNLYVKINTETGIQNFVSKPATFSEIFGPVSIGFLSNIETYTDAYSATVTARIYICKNSGPFVLKSMDTKSNPNDTNPLKINYKIDF